LQPNNHATFFMLRKKLKDLNANPQFVLFSATYSDDIIENAKAYVGDFTLFTLPKEALKLTGV
jgi:superfamily II DNA/RNA helicase